MTDHTHASHSVTLQKLSRQSLLLMVDHNRTSSQDRLVFAERRFSLSFPAWHVTSQAFSSVFLTPNA